jgi:hypothetical protein
MRIITSSIVHSVNTHTSYMELKTTLIHVEFYVGCTAHVGIWTKIWGVPCTPHRILDGPKIFCPKKKKKRKTEGQTDRCFMVVMGYGRSCP